MKENVITGIITVIVAGVSAYLKIIAIPIIVLIIAMIIDYGSGMAAAYSTSELSSKKGIKGILKKLGYLALVCVGILIDYILYSALNQIGFENPLTMIFGLLVTIWLIINELISILENLSRLGVPVPEFLVKLISKLKITVEKAADTETNKNDKPI